MDTYLGLISRVRWVGVKEAPGREKAWARIMRSMLAELPYLPVTTTQGVVARREDTCGSKAGGFAW